MNKSAAFTIVAKNYLAYAVTLFESMRKHHPEIDRYLFVVDQLDSPAKALEGLDGVAIVPPLDVFDSEQFYSMAYGYDVTEFNTAVKPFVMRHLLTRGYSQVLYFDPDIYIFGSVQPLLDALSNHPIVLTPHTTDPMPLDDLLPGEITFLLAGTYNLGFIGVCADPEGLRFLDWWADRLALLCVNDQPSGLFVDQRWINLVPGIFKGVAIEHGRQYNVAYWNLNARAIDDTEWTSLQDGTPIAFFHFSGFDADTPRVLSRHQNRIDAERHPGLLKLLAFYAGRLKANGHGTSKKAAYGFGHFSNGVPIDNYARAAFRKAQMRGMHFAKPYDVDAQPSLYQWLNAPIEHDSGVPHITNYLYELWNKRVDVRSTYWDVTGQHRVPFFSWLSAQRAQGVDSHFIDAAFAGQAKRDEPVATARTARGPALPELPQLEGSSRMGALGSIGKSLVRRLINFYVHYQQTINETHHGAIQALIAQQSGASRNGSGSSQALEDRVEALTRRIDLLQAQLGSIQQRKDDESPA